MPRSIERELRKIEQLPKVSQPNLDLASLVELQPCYKYVERRQSSAVFKILTDGLKERHLERLLDVQRDQPPSNAFAYYVFSWADRHAWFGESFGPMGPFVIPDGVADWLAALPDNQLGFKPGDVCWECACFYPYYRQRRPGGDFLNLNPWLGRSCLLCGAKIAPRFHSSLSFGLTNEQLENAPYMRKREEMESVWSEQVREADRLLQNLAPERVKP